MDGKNGPILLGGASVACEPLRASVGRRRRRAVMIGDYPMPNDSLNTQSLDDR